MNAIRPLLTLTILLVLGIFLWYRISNPGLVTTGPELEPVSPIDSITFDGAPPFTTGDPASVSATPPASAAPDEGLPVASTGPITPLDSEQPEALPPLPPLATEGTESPSSLPSTAGLPNSGNDGLPSEAQPAATANSPASDVPPAADGAITPVEEGLLAGQTGTATAPPAPRYGAEQEFAGAASQFAVARAEIDRALAGGDLRAAHQLLTSWYGDRTLTLSEQEEVGNLLSQLAGTLIYSKEFALEPHHTVGPGETLETIAAQYQVPWQLLAKINGIATPEGVTSGQAIKVLQGPFSAVVDAENQELALMVAGLYAGRFTVKVEGMANSEGEWTVAQKEPGEAGTPKHIVLTGENAPGSFSSIVLGTASVDSPAAMAGAIRTSPADQDDLFDILSVGSKVIIRR